MELKSTLKQLPLSGTAVEYATLLMKVLHKHYRTANHNDDDTKHLHFFLKKWFTKHIFFQCVVSNTLISFYLRSDIYSKLPCLALRNIKNKLLSYPKSNGFQQEWHIKNALCTLLELVSEATLSKLAQTSSTVSINVTVHLQLKTKIKYPHYTLRWMKRQNWWSWY